MNPKNKLIILLIFFSIAANTRAQVEHVAISHPVYDFLLHMETKGLLKHFSLSDIPLQRNEITDALREINSKENKLSNSEKSVLHSFLSEFEIINRFNTVLFESSSDTNQILFEGLISDRDKLFYRYSDSSNKVSFIPLASIEYIQRNNTQNNNKAILGNLGFRLFGTLDNCLGYYLQVTNGILVSGERSVALEDNRLRYNVKFADLNSDFDFTESHIIYRNKWFFAEIGRENRKLGSGLYNTIFMSDNSPAHDQLTTGVMFETFSYKYTHHSLLGVHETRNEFGVDALIPAKYAATHRFSLKPAWGEIAFWEHVIYSGRYPDLAYLNPLSFFKSIEHSLHDRDNSLMGLDATIRFAPDFQFKGSYLLDDIIFREIGNGFWANKSAVNAGIIYSGIDNMNIGFEYTRIEPYTYSHFRYQNSYTNDSLIYGSYLLPNSDEFALMFQYWLGGRYPLKARIAYQQHGANIYSTDGTLLKNVGSDPFIARRSEDSYFVTFLDGKKYYITSFELEYGWEIVRNFNLQVKYLVQSINDEIKHLARINLRFEDF